MLKLLPEPKIAHELPGSSRLFSGLAFDFGGVAPAEVEGLLEVARLRLAGKPGLGIAASHGAQPRGTAAGPGFYEVEVSRGLEGTKGVPLEDAALFLKQGYRLELGTAKARLRYGEKAGFVNAVTSLKRLLASVDGGFALPSCDITDWPTVEHRAVAPTFSWYAGYGRIGFDMQLWGFDEWAAFLGDCVDNKINQLNMVMYGYWPFEFPEYPETVFKDVPVKVWNAENARWLTVRYSHPNVEDGYLADFIALAHELEVKVFAYVGLNSYNGAYSIKHPERRMVKPAGSGFMNDSDSICLSDEGNVAYILASMRKIAGLGFDGFTLEESEEGFWFCNCPRCSERWGGPSASPVEAKHKANMWLLNRIYVEVRKVNPRAIIGIRAFRQPPLEKDPAFLRDCVAGMPEDIMLFWAPALYVPPSEFKKWIAAFGKERIWGRDTEANAITSTMGRLFRVFESNMLRYADEPNAQVIERDIEQHLSSAAEGVAGINGFMFEWYGLFLFLWAHGNYGWGSRMGKDEFFELSCEIAFGKELGHRVLSALRGILTIHESQMPFYKTPFPFQKNKVARADIPAIEAAKLRHPGLLGEIRAILVQIEARPELAPYAPHFRRIENAERRNAVIYDMALASLRYEEAASPDEKERCLDEILRLNERDFNLVKELFFDVNPVSETGVKSCMYPYFEIKREIHNIRHPERPDDGIVCSGIEALGWLWL